MELNVLSYKMFADHVLGHVHEYYSQEDLDFMPKEMLDRMGQPKAGDEVPYIELAILATVVSETGETVPCILNISLEPKTLAAIVSNLVYCPHERTSYKGRYEEVLSEYIKMARRESN